ncbi:MAG: 30S ribosomal protein S12 methylthiotransferase RimO [Clostridia bacterium]|nr:30S ribosomal protein S12 methylthiotransferase RimO [Clostridia bacterium]
MKKNKVYLLALGCPKNLVNSEQMLYLLEQAGYEIVTNAASADVAIVNTCGFIDNAKSEAIESILELAELKKDGTLCGLIVCGCLSQRYGDQFETELPEVDAVLGTGSYHEIVQAVDQVLNGKRAEYFAPIECAPLEGGRKLLTPAYSAYLRIAEGCDNRCSYCVIPYLRGPFRSRSMEDVIAEAKLLAADGAKELLIVAQDITRFGTDNYGKRMLPALLRELCKIDGVEWIRLHYLYPEEMDDELLLTCAEEEKILNYFDIPIQHISDKVLRDMNRRGTGKEIRQKIDRIRQLMPDAVIRTSLIVGFPGETEEDFEELCQFLTEYRLERAGVFCYSQEEGSPAAEFDCQIDENVKEERRAILYGIQERIMDEASQKYVGKTLKVLCCGADERGKLGRSFMDSPDIDGLVIIDGDAIEGEFVNVTITAYDGCDLYGRIKEE